MYFEFAVNKINNLKRRQAISMINTILVEYVIFLIDVIKYLLTLLLGKNLFKNLSDEPVKKEYQKLQVDELPIFDVPEKRLQACLKYRDSHGNSNLLKVKISLLYLKTLCVLNVVLRTCISMTTTVAEDSIFARYAVLLSTLKTTIKSQ